MSALRFNSSIDSLPDEVLVVIFDHLNLQSVKNASLTCRRWHKIIFFSDYINRFQFEIDLCRISYPAMKTETEKENEVQLEKVIDTVNHTRRCYSALRLSTGYYKADAFTRLWNSLHPKVTEHLYSLSFDINRRNYTLRLLADALPRMQNLRTLSLYNFYHCDEENILRSSSVRDLKMPGYIKIDMPALESFEGFMRVLEHSYTNSPLMFAKLKHANLTIDSAPALCSGSSFIHRLVHLETLTLRLYSKGIPHFIAICNSCIDLNELHFSYMPSDHTTYPTIMSHLTKLVNLRRLSFCPLDQRWDGSTIFCQDIDLSTLTQLEELDLGRIVLDSTSLVRLPKGIRSLTINVSKEHEEHFIQIITGSLTQLQTLRLVYTPFQCKSITQQTFCSLHLLKQLEVLAFLHARIDEPVFLYIDAPMHCLRKLLFEHCRLNNNSLQGLQEKFPNLKQPEFTPKSSAPGSKLSRWFYPILFA